MCYKETFETVFADYERMRGNLYCRLVDPARYDGGGDLLLRPWMDLALCCYYDLEADGLPGLTAAVRSSCLSYWHVSREKIFRDAWRNTEDLSRVLFRRLDQVLAEMGDEDCMDAACVLKSPLYMLSSEDKRFGAVYMAVPAVRRRIAKILEGSYYILPSSIHECMILRETKEIGAEELNHLVKTVNDTCVSEREILADHVYYYDRELDRIRTC